MPIIHDNPWLIEQLLKAAQAPPPPTETPVNNQQQVADALRALMLNLQNQTTPGRGGIEHAGDSVSLGQQHMDSMGDFIEFLNSNQTKFNGKQIVFAAATHPQSPGEDYDYVKIEPGTKMATVEEKGTVRPTAPNRAEVAYWVQIAALKSYLVSLQQDKDIQSKPTAKLQLLNLIRSSNENLDTDLSEQYKEEVQDRQVDGLPPVLDMKNWNAQGSKPLWLHDLKDINTLNAALGKDPMTAVKVGNHPQQTMRDMHWNQCAAINVIAARARSYLQNASPEAKGWATAYSKAITDIAKSVNCSLSGASDTWGDDSGGGEGGEGRGQPTAGVTPQQLIGLATLLPFDANVINLEDIKTFVDQYARIKPNMAALAQQVHSSMNLAAKIMTSPGAPIQIGNTTPEQVKLWTPHPKLLMNYLYSIISVAGRMYADFFNSFKAQIAQLQGGDRMLRDMEQQVASGGPQQANIADITTTLSSLPNVGPRR